MSLKKRHIGRRVAGVGVGVALMVLGLQAPAFAAAPTVTSFTPTSGPEGCVVVVTGTGFTDFPDMTRTMTSSSSRGPVVAELRLTFDVASATEIWATVPVLARGNCLHDPSHERLAGPGRSTATVPGHGGRGRRRVRANDHLVHADMWHRRERLW